MEEKKDKKALFVYLKKMPFVEEDYEIVCKKYEVNEFHFDAERATSVKGFLSLLLRQIKWLVHEIREADVIYGWFGDYHLLLPVVFGVFFRVPVIISIAGFDAIHIPHLNYGVYDSKWRKKVVEVVYSWASLLLPVSETLMYTENQYSAYPKRLRNGVRAHIPSLRTPYKVIHFGYDPDEWPMGNSSRDPMVCTVGYMPDDRTLRRKGVDLLFEAAQLLPEVTFEVVGVPENRWHAVHTKYEPPENVSLEPPVPRERLPEIYGHASVYAQVSRAEGQPNVLCEAMCCGCIPVGSDVFGIPETIGETGWIVEVPKKKEIAEVLSKALKSATPGKRRAARNRVVKHFSRKQRRRDLLSSVESVHE